MGLMQDLVTQSPLGMYAMSYGLVAMFVVSTQQLVYHAHPLTHVSLAMVGGLVTAVVFLVHGWFHPPGPGVMLGDGTPAGPVRLAPLDLFKSALYTAALSPLLLGGLQRLRRVFAFEPTRRRLRSYVPRADRAA
jgi:rod shape-determining protein MreD